ncbi:unnamed protein product, partial [Rotaria sp. Silwood2]
LHVVLRNYTDDNVELAVRLLKECGQKLLQGNRQELDSTFSILSNLLREPSLNNHTQHMIRDLFTVRRDEFEAHPAIQSGLDLVYENEVFKYDEEYEVNENKYKQIRKTILNENSDDEDESSSNTSDNHEDQSNFATADNDKEK